MAWGAWRSAAAALVVVLVGAPASASVVVGGALWHTPAVPPGIAAQAEPTATPENPAPKDPERADRPVVSIGLAGAGLVSAWLILRRRWYDPVPLRPGVEPPLGRIADWPVLLMGGMVVWVAQAIGASSAGTLFSITPDLARSLRGSALVSWGGYAGALAGAVFAVLVLPGIARRIHAERAGLGAAVLARAAAAMALTFPIVMTLGWAAAAASNWLRGETPGRIAHETLRLLSAPGARQGEDAVWWWLTAGAVVIGAPVIEELVYRGFIQSAIRRGVLWAAAAKHPLGAPPVRRAGWAGVLGASAIFAAMHAGVAEPHALITLLGLSIAFGVVFERTRSLAAPVVMHVLFNAANLALAGV
jgi:membrane protease YdiL (CAAX protease family)